MKRIGWVMSWVIMAVVFAAGVETLLAAEASFGVTGNSAYVWRGITFNDGVVLQPSLDVKKGGFGLNVWGNFDIDDYDDTLDNGQFSELDLTLSYGVAIQSVAISVGYIEYLFPNAESPAGREIFTTASVEPLKGLSFGIAFYYEVDEVEDYYANLNAAYAYSVTETLSLKLGVAAGYIGEEYSAGGESGLNDICASLSASYAFTPALSMTAGYYYVDTLDEDVLPEQDVTSFGGIGASYLF